MRQRAWTLLDDFDGTPAAETVTFTIDGVTYEIDLSADNAAEWRETVAPWIAAARRVPQSRKPAARKPRRKGPSPAAVRAWAAENGHDVKPSGKIPNAVLAAYDARPQG